MSHRPGEGQAGSGLRPVIIGSSVCGDQSTTLAAAKSAARIDVRRR